MNGDINNFLVIIFVCYSLVHFLQFFKKQKSWKEVIIPAMLPIGMLFLLTEFEKLAASNTAELARVLVMALVLIALIIVILILLRSRYVVLTSVFLVILIYFTLSSTTIPSSDVTTDPNVELYVVDC